MRSGVLSANERTELKPIGQSEAAWHLTQGCCWVYLHHPGSNYLYTLHTPHSSQLWLTYRATINMSRPEPSLATEYTTERRSQLNKHNFITFQTNIERHYTRQLPRQLSKTLYLKSIPIQWSIEREGVACEGWLESGWRVDSRVRCGAFIPEFIVLVKPN